MSKIVRRVLLCGLVSVVIYPLSFAPLDLAIYGNDVFLIGAEFRMPVFRPVTLLIDHTPLRKPLLIWSNLFGLEWRHRVESDFRCWQLTQER